MPHTVVKPALRLVPPARIQFVPEDRAWIAARIEEVLSSGQLTLGKYGKQFEENFAQFCGVCHAIATNSGTSALEIIFRSLDIAGKDVLVPTNTFFATAAAILQAGGRPVFVDMDPETFGVSERALTAALTPNTVGLVVVHIAGIVSGEMPAIRDLSARKGLWLVEDAAHAHGSSFGGVSAGTFGHAGAFSFYPTKVMTSAEGGMIVTNNDRLNQEARIFRDQGKEGFLSNFHIRMGHNWRMSEPHAIIGVKHMERLPAMIEDRWRIAALYDELLRGHPRIHPLSIPSGGECCYYKYVAVVDGLTNRKALKQRLRDEYAIGLSGEVYEDPCHRQPVFAPWVSGPMPVAEEVLPRHICLPVFSGMDDDDAIRVVQALREVLD